MIEYDAAAVTERLERVGQLNRAHIPVATLPDYSPVEVERRLQRVSQLRRLCLDLGTAGRDAGL